MRVFILAPANVATGGPELLHQFARCLTKRGIETYMVYPDADGINCPVPEVYWKYDNRYVSQYIDSGDSVLVLPETQIHHIDLCQKGTAMVWWLSVNNYFRSYKSLVTESSPDVFRLKLRKNVVHFAQSHYAKMFVTQHFGITPPDCPKTLIFIHLKSFWTLKNQVHRTYFSIRYLTSKTE